jgi:hypothetical protein
VPYVRPANEKLWVQVQVLELEHLWLLAGVLYQLPLPTLCQWK